jgi:hypothetical protein
MSKSKKLTPQEEAEKQVADIRDVLYVLGSVTADRIAEELNLDVSLVRRRLVNAGPGVHKVVFQKFAYNTVTKLWALTALGWRESEQALGPKKKRA